MFSKNKSSELKEIDLDQHESIEKAQSRIKQKKGLYYHFVFFLLGSVFMIIINKVLKYGDQYNWFLWGVLFWGFILLIHFINVFITNKFLGKEWEREQREKLIVKQKNKIAKLQKEVEKEYPIENNSKTTL